jgi:hypothetical protein
MTVPSLAAPALIAHPTIETRASPAVCLTALGIAAVSFGAPTVTVVAQPIAADLGGDRWAPALAYSLAWPGSARDGAGSRRAASPSGSACAGR